MTIRPISLIPFMAAMSMFCFGTAVDLSMSMRAFFTFATFASLYTSEDWI